MEWLVMHRRFGLWLLVFGSLVVCGGGRGRGGGVGVVGGLLYDYEWTDEWMGLGCIYMIHAWVMEFRDSSYRWMNPWNMILSET